jgi:hypothetical protein
MPILLRVALFVFLVGLATASPPEARAEDPLRICYFSLNNQREYSKTKQFVEKLNPYLTRPIVVEEFHTPGGDANETFRKMVRDMTAAGTHCDGLVITGHHTGRWGGQLSSAPLRLPALEEISCDPAYKEWFEGVNALWLQGCRSLGVGEIRPSTREEDEFSPDFHTWRVADDLDDDGLSSWSMRNLNRSFTATIDPRQRQRYWTMFPAATEVGWGSSAPSNNPLPGDPKFGKKPVKHSDEWNAEYSIPLHIAFTARAASGRKSAFAHPMKPVLDEAAAMAAQLRDALTPARLGGKACEDYFMTGARQFGQASGNPGVKTQKRFEASGDAELADIREKNCILGSPKATIEQKLAAVDDILKNKRSIAYNFSSLWGVLEGWEGRGPSGEPVETTTAARKAAAALRDKLAGNEDWMNYLRDTVKSPNTGILDRLDYYGFYARIKQAPAPELVTEVRARLKRELLRVIEPKSPDEPVPDKVLQSADEYKIYLYNQGKRRKIADDSLAAELMPLVTNDPGFLTWLQMNAQPDAGN